MLRWIGSLVVVVILALLGLAGWVLGTESGSNWLAREAASLTGGAVRITGVHGNFVDGLEVDELAIVAGTTQIGGQGLVLRVLPASLLSGRLSIATLRAQRIELVIPPAAPPTGKPFQTPRLSVPFLVEVDELGVDVLEIHSGASARTVTGIRVAGSMHGTRLELRQLQGGLGGFELRAEGSARFEAGLPVDARVEWRLTDPALSGSGTVRGNLAALEFSQVVNLPDAVTVSGTLYDIIAGPRVKATANWDSVQLQVPGIGAVQSRAGRVTLEGTLAAWNATLATAARSAALPDVQAHGTAHGDRTHAVFDELRLDGDFGALNATGDVDLGPERRLRLDITAANVNTAAFRQGLEGNLSARASLDAKLSGDVRVKVVDLRGRLMGRPLAGAGELLYQDGLLTFNDVVVRAGPNRLRAAGSLGERLAGGFDLEAPDLAVLWPDLAGSLDAHATLGGTRAQPLIDLDATGRRLLFAGNAVKSLELRARVDNRRQLHADLAARGIESGNNVLGDLDASLQGSLDAHELTAHLTGGVLAVDLVSRGSWNGSTLQHRVASAQVATDAFGPWQLAGEPEVAVRAGAATAGDHCWEQAPASLCLSGLTWSPDRTHLTAELRNFDLQHLDRWLPQDVGLTGRGYAALSMELTAAGPNGSAIWRQEDTTVTYTGGDDPLVTPLQTAQVAAQFTPEEVLATLEFHAASGVHLSGNGRMRSPFGADAPIEARIAGRLPDIAPLLPWLAGNIDVSGVAGNVTLDAAVAGSLAAPRVTGEVRLAGGALALADLGLTIEAIDIALLGDGSETLKLQGSARAGGPLTLDGEISPIEAGGPTGWVRIRGDRVDAVRLPDRYIQASPDITLRYARGVLMTEGGVTIPKAEIVVRALPQSAVSPSGDAVVRDREAADTGSGAGEVIGGELAITFGRDVHLKAFGLDTFLEGTVKLSQGADGEAQGFGVVRLREGKFGAYGKQLTIDRGTLGFAGPLDDPAVDLRASRVVDWEGRRVTAGVLVSGTAMRPESRVFSDPAMSEADALSYLISGRPIQSANATDRSAIAGAALALGVQQTSSLTQALGSAVTLDELGVQGGTLDETEVVAGKQLGSDLYVRFTYGLFNRIGTVLARYKLGRNLSIEAASGEDQSLDLIYSVERE